MNYLVKSFVFLLAIGSVLSGCFKEEFTMSGDATLEFTADTVRFNTVFTSLGSATRSFRVHNRTDLPVKISRVYLQSEASFFRINVDGSQGPEVKDVEILNGDSIWIFVEVRVDPDQPPSASPFVIEDYVVFELNGNQQQVLLEAWGQNANYIPGPGQGNTISILTCDMGVETWDDPRPYVIYGTLLIDSCTVVWPAGARIYIHGGVANNPLGIYNDGLIYTLPRGRIRSEGEVNNRVLVSDDRIEPDYTGVWSGISLGPASGPHKLNYTTVRYAVTGVVADSASRLDMEGTIIHGNSGSGLFARHSTVNATNCLMYDNAAAGVALTYGGNYSLDYVTIASYGNNTEGLIINDFYCQDQLCSTGVFVNSVAASLRNCIIAGSSRDEISLTNAAAEIPQVIFDVMMTDCVVTVDELLDEDNFPGFLDDICMGCEQYMFGDTLFVDESSFDFHLDTMSIALDMARPLQSVTTDLEGFARDPETPDTGCYEFQ